MNIHSAFVLTCDRHAQNHSKRRGRIRRFHCFVRSIDLLVTVRVSLPELRECFLPLSTPMHGHPCFHAVSLLLIQQFFGMLAKYSHTIILDLENFIKISCNFHFRSLPLKSFTTRKTPLGWEGDFLCLLPKIRCKVTHNKSILQYFA